MSKSFKKISDSAAAREQQSKIDALLSGTTNYPAEASSLQSPTPPTSPLISSKRRIINHKPNNYEPKE